MEHSWEVATIAHALALIRKRIFGGDIDPAAVATAALYHDCSEVITGDMPSPVKYHYAAIQQAYQSVERAAQQELVAQLPHEMKAAFERLLIRDRRHHEPRWRVCA